LRDAKDGAYIRFTYLYVVTSSVLQCSGTRRVSWTNTSGRASYARTIIRVYTPLAARRLLMAPAKRIQGRDVMLFARRDPLFVYRQYLSRRSCDECLKVRHRTLYAEIIELSHYSQSYFKLRREYWPQKSIRDWLIRTTESMGIRNNAQFTSKCIYRQ